RPRNRGTAALPDALPDLLVVLPDLDVTVGLERHPRVPVRVERENDAARHRARAVDGVSQRGPAGAGPAPHVDVLVFLPRQHRYVVVIEAKGWYLSGRIGGMGGLLRSEGVPTARRPLAHVYVPGGLRCSLVPRDHRIPGRRHG